MGLTKQYLRTAPGPVFGLVAGPRANLVTLPSSNGAPPRAAVGACELVIVWDLVKKEKVLELCGGKAEVTRLAASSDNKQLAVGYADGAVRVFDLATGTSDLTFQGHKSAVTALNYDAKGLRLVSGAKDTDVVVWDVVGECGLFRLRGHKKEVTQAVFMHHRELLVTSSKDSFVKFWDLSTQHCFYTLVGHRAEVYDFVLLREETRLLTGSVDSELRVWDIQYLEDDGEKDDSAAKENSEDAPEAKKAKLSTEENAEDSDDERTEEEKANDEAMRILTCTKMGSVLRQARDRVASLTLALDSSLLLCHGPDKHLEVFALPSQADLTKLQAKRLKKLRKRHLDDGSEVDATAAAIKLTDDIKALERFRFTAKLWSASLLPEGSHGAYRLSVLLADNKVDSGQLKVEGSGAALEGLASLSLPGHRSDIRTVAVSLDNHTIMSASGEEVKLWNRDSQQCVRTLTCGYALCSMFTPGDRHAVIGTKSGLLQLFDLSQGTLLEQVQGHMGAAWSIAPSPDQRGFVSGGADKEVKFWNYEMTSDHEQGEHHKVLTLEHRRTLKMDEDVLAVKFSPDHKLLAVALLDSTVKVFFADSLKFFLSLYGHKLPVTSLDISSDSTLIVTGSADRNIKIWGLDFGDCHKSIFAHDESVTCVRFVPKTHLFFSAGKDKKLKQWDADNFESIQTLEGHQGEVRALAVSPSGHTVVTAAADRSLRLWEKTEEPLVLQEEREDQREEEEDLLRDGEDVVAGETTEEVKMAEKKTLDTIKGTERVLEALEIYTSQIEEAKTAPGGKVAPHPMMLAYKCITPTDFMAETLRRIKPSDLLTSLLSLPFSAVSQLLAILATLLQSGRQTELAARAANFLLKVHAGEITSSAGQLAVVARLRQHCPQAVSQLRDMAAFNLAGLSVLKKQYEESSSVMLFADATAKRKKKKRATLVIK